MRQVRVSQRYWTELADHYKYHRISKELVSDTAKTGSYAKFLIWVYTGSHQKRLEETHSSQITNCNTKRSLGKQGCMMLFRITEKSQELPKLSYSGKILQKHFRIKFHCSQEQGGGFSSLCILCSTTSLSACYNQQQWLVSLNDNNSQLKPQR